MAIVVQTAPTSEPLTVAEVLRHCRIDQSNQELAPGALTAALISPAVAGNLTAGVYRWRVTFVTADGETEGGTVSSTVTVANPAVAGKATLTDIPLGGSLVTARKIYRTAANGSTYLLVTTINDNTTTSYTDNIADASLGAGCPSTNTTSDPQITMLIKVAREAAERELKRYLITQTLDAYYDEFPECFYLPPLQSVTSITYTDLAGDTQTLATDQYVVNAYSKPAEIEPAYAAVWPAALDQENSIRIRFVAGYGAASAVPACIKQWMLMHIKQNYDNPSPAMLGSTTEQNRNYVDGLLDAERVYW